MDLGHGFLPRIDARNYKAVERCLPRDGPGLFNVGLDLPWVVLEGPWALQCGASTIELCRDRGVSFLVDTQAWRYRDPRTFTVDKFTATPYAPRAPLARSDRSALSDFVEADLKTQAALGASAYLLPGFIPTGPHDDIYNDTLALLEIAQEKLPEARPCIAFVGVHTASMDAAQRLIDALPHWIDGVYLQPTPVNPLRDSPAKIIDGLMLMRRAAQQGFTVIAGRLVGLTPLLRAAGIPGADAGLGEGESFVYGAKVKNHEPRATTDRQPRLPMGRLYVPQLGRSVSAAEWARLMQIPALRGQLLCRLPCCAFGLPVETTPQRGREHSLHCRVAEAKALSEPGRAAVDAVIALLEQRQSTGRAIDASLREAGVVPVATDFLDNHLAVAHFLKDALSAAA
jgi:hypothetical protein